MQGFVDFVSNGQAFGQVGQALEGCRYDPGLMRPYFDRTGERRVTLNVGWNDDRSPRYKSFKVADLQARGIYSPVFNATSLRKEEWIELDKVVVRQARFRLTAWGDLVQANSFGGFNGMSKLILEHETQSDPGEAVVDMDGLTEGRSDQPQYQLQGLPLPITHADFWVSSRKLAISRNSGTPFDAVMGEAAGRRVAESIEKTLIGVDSGITYGGNSTQVGGYGRTSAVYGYLNFTARIQRTGLYRPTGNGRSGTGWVAQDTLRDVLSCLDALKLQKFYGPFMVYHSNDWDQYMDNDYILTGGNVATQTLRERLLKIKGITDVKRLDFLAATVTAAGDPANILTANPFTLIFVQMTPDVCRAVNGMDITTVQWEAKGGMQLMFKVMAIQVPQLRADYAGNCGVLTAVATI